MNTQITFPEGIPLNYDDRGRIRVNGTRVTLDTLVGYMQQGETPERLHEGFPSVTLAEINTILDWYRNNQVEADKYLREQEAEGERIRQEIESQPEYQARRAELLRRISQLTKT